MIVELASPITHLCPFKDEVDVGTVTIKYEWGSTPLVELHELAAALAAFHNTKISHEDLTLEIAALVPHCRVETRWQTAGIDITCVA